MTEPLLTIDELKGYIPDSSESDDILDQRIEDTLEEINERFGTLVDEGEDGFAEITETVYNPGRTMLPLSQEPDEILEVTEDDQATAIDADGYRIRGRSLIRRNGLAWSTFTTVRYRPKGGRAARRRALIKLIQLDMGFTPGMNSQSGGPWTESYKQSYAQAREDIFATLGEPELFA